MYATHLRVVLVFILNDNHTRVYVETSLICVSRVLNEAASNFRPLSFSFPFGII